MTRLGLRLALAGGRHAFARLALVAAGVAVAVAILLLVLGYGNAQRRIDHRVAARTYGAVGPGAGAPIKPGHETLAAIQRAWIDGRGVTTIGVAPTGPGAPLPPGVSRLPAPGTAIVSPALKRLLDGPNASTYQALVPWRIVGEVGHGLLADPRDLVAVVGWQAERLAETRQAVLVREWQTQVAAPSSPHRTPVGLLAAAMLLPVLVFLWVALRLATRTTERRLEALRLAGGSRRQVAQIAATEAALAGLVGALAGAGLSLLLRPLPERHPIAGFSCFASDLAPTAGQWLAVLIGVPLLAALGAAGTVWARSRSRRRREPARLGLRFALRIGDLAVRFSAVRLGAEAARKPRRWPWVAAALLLALVVGRYERQRLPATREVAAFAVAAIALVVAGPLVVRGVARLLIRAEHPAALLAGRRLQDDPRRGYAALTGIVLGLFAATVVSAYTTAQDRVNAAAAPPTATSPSLAMLAVTPSISDGVPPPAVIDELATRVSLVDGVHADAAVWQAWAAAEPGAPGGASVAVADCAELARLSNLTAARLCTAPALVPDDQFVSAGDPLALRFETDLGKAWLLRTRAGRPAVWPYTGGSALIVDRGSVPQLAHLQATVRVLARTDGTRATFDRVRAEVSRVVPLADVEPAGSRAFVPPSDPHNANERAGTALAFVVMAVVAAISLLVTTLEGLVERRRTLATLVAAGTPARSVRLAVALELLVPLLAAAVVAVALGAATALALQRSRGLETVLPLDSLAAFAALALGAGLLAALAALPAVGRVLRPDQLRTE